MRKLSIEALWCVAADNELSTLPLGLPLHVISTFFGLVNGRYIYDTIKKFAADETLWFQYRSYCPSTRTGLVPESEFWVDQRKEV